MTTNRALVIGAAGMLGTDVCAELTARGESFVALGGRSSTALPSLDITNTAAVRAALEEHRPSVVYHCAAWTDVDGAERTPDPAYAVNALGSWNVAAACAAVDALMVFVSTDFVFDGGKATPYTEFDTVNPLGAYGASKEAGERLVRQTLPDRHIIARTSWLFGPHGKNFVKTIQRLAEKLPTVPIVADQIGCPTHTADLARKIVELAADPLPGTYHVSGTGQCSWFDFARAIVERGNFTAEVVPITAAEYAERFKSPTNRPAYSVMRHQALEMRGMNDMPDWETALDHYLTRMRGMEE